MPPVSHLALAGVCLVTLCACVSVEPDTKPQEIDREIARTVDTNPCPFGQPRVYRPTPDRKAPYDAVIPPTYDTPSQVPSHCRELDK